MDLQRYQAAFAKNAIAKQQLDDQEQTVVQDEGTVKADEGTVAYDQVQLSLLPHRLADHRPRRPAAGGSRATPSSRAAGSTLVVITQLQPITVVFNVSEDDLPQVQAQLKGDASWRWTPSTAPTRSRSRPAS
jgi:multidrug efflux system membrane fusion protein